ASWCAGGRRGRPSPAQAGAATTPASARTPARPARTTAVRTPRPKPRPIRCIVTRAARGERRYAALLPGRLLGRGHGRALPGLLALVAALATAAELFHPLDHSAVFSSLGASPSVSFWVSAMRLRMIRR